MKIKQQSSSVLKQAIIHPPLTAPERPANHYFHRTENARRAVGNQSRSLRIFHDSSRNAGYMPTTRSGSMFLVRSAFSVFTENLKNQCYETT
jgi:hypothetical protein